MQCCDYERLRENKKFIAVAKDLETAFSLSKMHHLLSVCQKEILTMH